MITLFIDTSTEYLTVALIKDDIILKETTVTSSEHSKYAMPEIERLFTETNIDRKSVNKIMVVDGPGSFTGIRIGITIAKTYAWSLNIPITTISALEAMSLSSKKETYHVPMIDARRKYVYAAIYDNKQKEILKPVHIKITDLKKELKKLDDYSIITNDEIEDFSKKEKYNPDILKIVNNFKDKKAINPHAVNPEYLKLTEAEESKLND